MTINHFLSQQLLTADAYDTGCEIERFRQEMSAGLAGEKSSLFMIPTFILPSTATLADETILVLDAGGTNLRVGFVTFRDGEIAQVDFEKCPLPGTERPLTCEEFFDAVAEKLSPYLSKGSKIGFCFSYAAQCMENKDAKLVAFCKEVQVSGAEGVEICRELDAAIRRRGITKQFQYVQLNDTVATQLGGMAVTDRSQYDGYIGFILGTGLNGCYSEKTDAIGKYKGSAYRESEMIINMEAGCYAGFQKGAVDHRIDSESAIPGDHQAEKLMAGAYLGRIIAEAIKVAAAAGLLVGKTDAIPKKLHMAEINNYMDGKESELDKLISPADKETVCTIIRSIYHRTAKLMSILFAAIALQRDLGKHKPVCVVVEGSTYQRTPLIQSYLKEELESIFQAYGIRFTVICAQNPTLTGAAFAAASNL